MHLPPLEQPQTDQPTNYNLDLYGNFFDSLLNAMIQCCVICDIEEATGYHLVAQNSSVAVIGRFLGIIG